MVPETLLSAADLNKISLKKITFKKTFSKRRIFTELSEHFDLSKYESHMFLSARHAQAKIHFWQAPIEKEARALGQESSCYILVDCDGMVFSMKTLIGSAA